MKCVCCENDMFENNISDHEKQRHKECEGKNGKEHFYWHYWK